MIKFYAIVFLSSSLVVHGLNLNAMKCGGVDMKLTEQQVMHYQECEDHVGHETGTEITIEKLPCFAKCVFEHKKLVDEKGAPHKENIANMLMDTMSPEIKTKLTTVLLGCLDSHVAEIDPSDDSCSSYTPLALCMHMGYMNSCKN